MKWMSYLKMGIAHWVVLLIYGMIAFAIARSLDIVISGGNANVPLGMFSLGLFGVVFTIVEWLLSGFIQPKIVGNKWLNSEKLL